MEVSIHWRASTHLTEDKVILIGAEKTDNQVLSRIMLMVKRMGSKNPIIKMAS